MKILVTGTAGFIGFYVAKALLERGDEVWGLDNINDYYDSSLKYARLNETGIQKEQIENGKIVSSNRYKNYKFIKISLEDRSGLEKIFKTENFNYVCHLAAQAGVRYSLTNPYAYLDSNLVGFINIIELAKQYKVKHFVYASSSSVYGLNQKMPFSTSDNVDHPISLYAATKKSNELMAHAYSHLYQLPVTGLRFFTVYGPWGRPDMAYYKFTKAIKEKKPIEVYNNGQMERDFTFIDDIVEGVIRVINSPPQGDKQWSALKPDPSSSPAPYKIYNIGNNSPVRLIDFIEELENLLGQKAIKKMLPIQPGDVVATYADINDLEKDFSYKPKTSIKEGLKKFVAWYLKY
jgi:UDP-glucuronate 4-epimerase